ncbi:glycosyltransferase family 1 protein [Methylosinus sp. Ce-a6]|uniref:glycosyltransferase family 4 protein n=1 Tax=Methylosinus sp. Ce-a6 TaxID=2172005 RepID=UPI00135B06D5|nr:glycosyltransferase family 1 protein [Methylosinus sp. Ce-a6]
MVETTTGGGRIEAFLLKEMKAEIDELAREEVDDYTKFLYARAREFYWTVTRLLGLGRLHDGLWRKPSAEKASAWRIALTGDIASPATSGRLLVDMTSTHRTIGRTGIQRVVREIARAMVESGAGIPVFMEEGRLFSHFTHEKLPDEVTPAAGDKFLLLDAGWHLTAEYSHMIDAVADAGGETIGCLYDLIPILYPSVVTDSAQSAFVEWFDLLVRKSDAIVGISKAVIDDFDAYARARRLPCKPGLRLGWWPLGADFQAPSDAAPSARAMQAAAGPAPLFLSVGTLEPRKGHAIALDAFDRWWREGADVRYVIVGSKGWNVRALQRRILTHPEFGRRLFWLQGVSDADLRHLYQSTRALVFPSIAEGFGLPLVEAAHFGARAIASDIRVFREVGGDWASYFDPADSDALLARMKEAMAAPVSAPPREIISWRRSAEELARILREGAYPSRLEDAR